MTERWLEALDVQTCSDIWKHRGRLTLIKSELGLTFLLRAYLGLGNTNIEPGKREDRKSVGESSPVEGVDALRYSTDPDV